MQPHQTKASDNRQFCANEALYGKTRKGLAFQLLHNNEEENSKNDTDCKRDNCVLNEACNDEHNKGNGSHT